MNKDFEIIPHTADLKIRIYGKDLEELFCHALQGMFNAMHPHIPSCTWHDERMQCDQLPLERSIALESPDKEALLVDFLSSALYLSDVHNEAYLSFTASFFSQTSIKAVLHGVSFSKVDLEIKAVTYHDLHIIENNGMLQVDIVFDI